MEFGQVAHRREPPPSEGGVEEWECPLPCRWEWFCTRESCDPCLFWLSDWWNTRVVEQNPSDDTEATILLHLFWDPERRHFTYVDLVREQAFEERARFPRQETPLQVEQKAALARAHHREALGITFMAQAIEREVVDAHDARCMLREQDLQN